ncbi:MAG: nitrilase-related carbon-nitrogen hydrolase [Candidatus Acidiferrales bacterium]
MASVPDPSNPISDSRRNHFAITGALLVSAAMFYFGTGLRPVWWLMWFAPLPVLLVAPRVRALPSFAMSTLAWFLGSLNMWHYLLGLIRLPVVLVVLSSLVPGCIFGLAVHLYRALIRRGELGRAAFAFPAVWVTYEFLNALSSPHSTFGNLGYSQMNFLPVLQVVSLTGIWGISFCLFLFPAAVAALLGRPAGKLQRIRLAATAGGFLLAVLAYGSLRLISSPVKNSSVKAGLMATNVPGDLLPEDDGSALKLLRKYLEHVDELAAQGARVIVLPEKIARISDSGTQQADALFQAAAARLNARIVVGLDRGTATQRFNEARIYFPDGSVKLYDKHHMIPRLEDVDVPGTSLTVWNESSGIWGIEICKDMDFPDLSRQYGARGVGLLLVPAWDFVLDDWLHGRMAVMRGVESGFAIARAAKQGLLTVTDNRGRVIAEQSSAAAPFSSLLAELPVAHDQTIYVRSGNWFGWLNVAGLLLFLFSRFWKRKSSS